MTGDNKPLHPAEIYRSHRARLLGIALKDFPRAYQELENLSSLDKNVRVGLFAEIKYYEENKDQGVAPTLDHGDLADFAQVIDGVFYRIDVTTNIRFKSVQRFNALRKKHGYHYKIALYENGAFTMVDINYPLCLCGLGSILDIVVAIGRDHDFEDLPARFDCYHVRICHNCGRRNTIKKFSDEGMLSILNIDFDHSQSDQDYRTSLISHAIRYLGDRHETYFLGLGSRAFEWNKYEGEAESCLRMDFRSNLIGNWLEQDMAWSREWN